ncbi:MAG: aminotransferase class III-fold pyridoxal phosphate-dependent enzyme, partial [Methanobacteriota archaeon]
AGETVRPLCKKLMDEGVLAKDTHERTIRFAPPLTITEEEIDWAVERIRRVLEGYNPGPTSRAGAEQCARRC